MNNDRSDKITQLLRDALARPVGSQAPIVIERLNLTIFVKSDTASELADKIGTVLKAANDR